MSKVVININISITINEDDKESSKDNQVSDKTQTPESTMTVDESGNKTWFNEDDRLHRTNGPAIEDINGYKAWCMNGKLHRLDGPAVEHVNGTKAWWVDGRELTEEEFNTVVVALKAVTDTDMIKVAIEQNMSIAIDNAAK